MRPHRADLTLLDRLLVQAEVLLPVLRLLQAQLGRQEAQRLLQAALDPVSRQAGAWVQRHFGDGEPRTSALVVHEYIAAGGAGFVVEACLADEEGLVFSVTQCRYRDRFAELGATDLGAVLACGTHLGMLAGVDGVRVAVTGTLMEGRPRCEFSLAFPSAASRLG
jgi:predicted ArsR family transcriptional regulator